MAPETPFLSVFIPAHNEAGNVQLLFDKIVRAFGALNAAGEIIFVDDGSTDSTWAEAQAAATRYPCAHLYRHRKSFGLTEAMRTGFRHCQGDIVVFLPSDLESDPEEDIPKLVAKINEGYDVVSGWRQGRRDGKIVASTIANAVSRRFFGLSVHDMNWIKAFRREVVQNLHLRSDWHRWILMIAAQKGNMHMLKQLLAAGADVNAKEAYMGMTPLMYAAMLGHVEVVRALVDAGACLDSRASDPNGLLAGCDALRLASISGHAEVVTVLNSVIKTRKDKE